MQKFLRTLMLAALFLPFASQAQTCDPISTFPVTYGFETSEGFPTGVTTVPTTNTLGDCWSNLSTDSTGSYGGRKWYVTSSVHHSGSQALRLPDKQSGNRTMLVFPSMNFTSPNGYVVSFWINRTATGSNPEGFKVYISDTDTIGPNAVELGHYSRNYGIAYPVVEAASGWYQYETPVITMTGTVYLIFEGHSYYGNFTDVDDIVIEENVPCKKVTDLAIDANATTSNSLTLTWTDLLNTGATYTVYNGEAVVASGVSATTYTVTGLEANTEYTFSVASDCGTDGVSGVKTVSGRTACAAMALPWSCGFEADEIQSTTAATALPWCSQRYVSVAATNGTTYPYSYSSSTYAHEGSRSLYYYGSTSASYPDTMAFILPQVDVTTYPMNANRVTFWARMSSASYSKNVYVCTMSDPADLTTLTLVDSVLVSGTTHTKYSVSLAAAAATDAYVVLAVMKGSGALYMDDLTLEEMPSCGDVNGLVVTGYTTSSITFSWNAVAGASYTIYDMEDTSIVGTSTDTTYTVTGLTAATAYTFGVQSNCTGGDGLVATVSSSTACEGNTVFPWSENFESFAASSSGVKLEATCWVNEHISGAGAYFFEVYSSTSGMTGNTTQMLRLHDMSNGTQTKLTLPAMSFPTGTTYLFTLDVLRNATGTSYTSEGVRVFASTDGNIEGATELGFLYRNFTQTDGNVVPAESASGWYTYSFAIPAGTVYIILRGESQYGSATYMDNFVIDEAPSCMPVSGLTLDGQTATSANIHWNNSGATGYEVEVRQNDVALTTVTVVVTDTTAEISGLSIDNDYQVVVRAVCGSDYSAWSGALNLHVGYCSPNPTSRDGQGITGVAFGGMTNTTTHPSTAPFYGNYYTMAGTVPAGLTASVDITFATGYTYGTIIWVDWNNSLTFDADEVVYRGTSTNDNPTVLTATFDIPATQAVGDYRMRIATADSYFDSYVSDPTSTPNPCFSSTYAVAEDYTLTVSAAPSCMPVSNLAASNITADGATLTWTGDAASYNVYAITATDTTLVQNVTTTTITLTGLTANTQCTYGVTSVCTSSESNVMTVTFSTLCNAVAIPFTETFEATSGTRDCWITDGPGTWYFASGDYSSTTGAYEGTLNANITHSDNGNVTKLISPVLDLGTADGMQLTFAHIQRAWSGDQDELRVYYRTSDTVAWVMAAEYTNEVSTWTVETLNLSGSIYQVAFEMTDGYGYGVAIDSIVFNLPPSCMAPAALAAGNITTDGATLTWNGDATSYNVYAIGTDTTLVQNVTTTSYDITGLTAMTSYTYGVRSVCGTDESDLVTVTFATACAAVTLPFTEDFEATSPTAACWTMANTAYSTGITTSNAYSGTQAFYFYYNTTPPQYLISPELSGADDGVSVSFMYRAQSTSYTETFHVGYSTTTNDTAAFTWGPEVSTNSTTYAEYSQILPAGTKFVAFKYTANDQYYLYIDSVVFNLPPACMPVTDLTVDSVTATSVFLSWNGTATAYNVYSATGDVIATGVTATSYEVTGLTASTSYTFGVTAVCGTDESPVTTVDARTDCAGGSCVVKIYATDGYGDGWEYSTLTISQNGATVATYNMANQGLWETTIYDTFQVSVCSGIPVSFSWTSGSDYDDEAGFQILDGNDTVLYTVNNASLLTDGAVFYTVADACGNNIPTPPLPDSMQVIIAVNDATMGTTNPAPGTHYFYEGDTAHVYAIPNTGYHLTGWSFIMNYSGVTYYDTTINTPVDDFFSLFNSEWVIEAGDNAYSFSVTANFAAGAAEPDTVTVNITVTDPTEGTTNPAPGTHYFETGDSLSVVALPANGYDLAGWVFSMVTGDGDTIYENQEIAASSYEFFDIFSGIPAVGPMLDGYVFDVTPIFTPDSGVVNDDSLVVITAVNDATMGTIDPAPGTHVYYAGDTFSVRAIPNAGYHVESWHVVMDYGMGYVYDTTVYVTLNEIFPLDTADYYFGMTMSFTANFAVGDAPVIPDSVIVNVSVNDATMGTVTPAPGTHYYVLGDTVLSGFQPNAGYYTYAVQMSISHPVYGVIVDTTITDTAELAAVAGMLDTLLIVEDPSMYGMIVNINVIFAAEGTVPDVYTVSVGYDVSRGTVTGAGEYVAGSTATLTAIPYTGYEFYAWVENNDTVGRQSVYTIGNIDADHHLTAIFVVKTGIEDVEADDVKVYSTDNVIVVRGAEGKPVVLFDVNGRMLSREARAAERVEFRVTNSGVYLVKVADAAAKRVVVIR